MNTLLQDMIEIADIPYIAAAGIDDIEDTTRAKKYVGLVERIPGHRKWFHSGAHAECKVCWWVYDPALGDDVWQIPPACSFNQLPDYWCCPVCETRVSPVYGDR